MPIQVQWYIPNHVVLMAVVGDISMDELSQKYDEALALVETGATIVHSIIDFQQAGEMPRNIREIQMILNKKSEKSGWTIVVGDNKLVRFIATIITNFLQIRFTYVNTLAEAELFLKQRDPNLTPNS